MFLFKPNKSAKRRPATSNMEPNSILPTGGETINTIMTNDELLMIFEQLTNDSTAVIKAAQVCKRWRALIQRYITSPRWVTLARRRGRQPTVQHHKHNLAAHSCYQQDFKGLVPDQAIDDQNFDYFNFSEAVGCFENLPHERLLQLRIVKCRLHYRRFRFEDTFMEQMVSLTKLVLVNIDLYDTDLGSMASSLPNLEELTIDNITAEGFHGHNIVLLGPKLRSLTLNGCRDLVSTTLTHALRDFCSRGMELEVLNLEGQCIADMDKCLTYTIIKKMASLKVWHFHVNLWSRITLPERFAAVNIEKMVLIQSHFDSSLVSDESFRVLFGEPLPKLRHLQLKGEGTRLSDDAFLLLLDSCPNLEVLELSRLIRLSPRALLAIGHQLGKRNLRRLSFSFMKLLPQMLENIVEHSPRIEAVTCEHMYFEREQVNDCLERLNQIYLREKRRPRLCIKFDVPLLRIDYRLIERAPDNLHIKVAFLPDSEIPDFKRIAYDHYPKSDRQIYEEYKRARNQLERRHFRNACSMQ